MNPVAKLIKADPERKTRLHDLQGHLVQFASLLSLPLASWDYALSLIGQTRVEPWLSYRGVRAIDRVLRPQSRVLEFGSGMSTVWFAQRVAHVLSIESDPRWHERVDALLLQRHLFNVDLQLRPADCATYTAVEESGFDFALIDGVCRPECILPALSAVRPGGYLYIDNTDAAGHGAEAVLLETLGEAGSTFGYFVDFAPGLASVSRGALVRVPDCIMAHDRHHAS